MKGNGGAWWQSGAAGKWATWRGTSGWSLLTGLESADVRLCVCSGHLLVPGSPASPVCDGFRFTVNLSALRIQTSGCSEDVSEA